MNEGSKRAQSRLRKEITMSTTLKLASWLFAGALFAVPSTLLAQTPDEDQSDDQSDACIAKDTAKEAFEDMAGLPTSIRSAYTMGLEKATGLPLSVNTAIKDCAMAAGLSEAAAGAVSLGVGTFFNPSSTATDEEEGNPYQMQQRAQQAQEAAAAYQFWLSHQAELNQSYSQWLRNLRPLPAGPQIVPCTQHCNK
jgi:hypothetical protein